MVRISESIEHLSLIRRVLRSSDRTNKELTKVNSGKKRRGVGAVMITFSKKKKSGIDDGNSDTPPGKVTLENRYDAKILLSSKKRGSCRMCDWTEPKEEDTLRITCNEGAMKQTADVGGRYWAGWNSLRACWTWTTMRTITVAEMAAW